VKEATAQSSYSRMTVSAPERGAGTGSDRRFSVSLWTGGTTELTVSVLVPCRRSVLAFASIATLISSISLIDGETA